MFFYADSMQLFSRLFFYYHILLFLISIQDINNHFRQAFAFDPAPWDLYTVEIIVTEGGPNTVSGYNFCHALGIWTRGLFSN